MTVDLGLRRDFAGHEDWEGALISTELELFADYYQIHRMQAVEVLRAWSEKLPAPVEPKF